MRSLSLFFTLLFFALNIAVAQTGKPGKATQSKGTIVNQPREIATLETSMGTFAIELYRNDAPKTVENFVKLAERGYFDGMRFHRVAKGFVIQTGDPKSKDPAKASEWGRGGESIYGGEFEDELDPTKPSAKAGYKKGVVAMANRGPNTNTSQFFICLADVGLPHRYTIFGKVIEGMNVVEKIGQVEIIPGMSPNDGRPKQDVLLKKVTVRVEEVDFN